MKLKLDDIQRNRKVLTELMIWVILLASPLFLQTILPNVSLKMVFILYAQLVLFAVIYYVNVLWLIPRFLFNGKTYIYLITIVLLLLFINLFIVLVFRPFIQMVFNNYPNTQFQFIREQPIIGGIGRIISYLLVVVLGVALMSFQRWQNQEQQNMKSQKEKLDTELAFLKNQINPHFFFNTMNAIYSLTTTNTEAAQATILKLSKLMRYLLYETEKQFTTLEKEIDFLQGYVDLMRIRLPENVRVVFNPSVTRMNSLLPPLLFISFIENAFKHGVSNTESCDLFFSLKEDDQNLIFVSKNSIHRKRTAGDGSGIGLENVKRRLALLYPSNEYQLYITETDHIFEVNLIIPF